MRVACHHKHGEEQKCCACSGGHSHQGKNKKTIIIRIVLALLFFLLALFNPFSSFPPLYIYLISYLIIAYDIIIDGLTNVFRNKNLDEKFLMTIASICAFLIQEYREAVLVILLYQIGEFIQNHAVDKGYQSINKLLSLKITTTHLLVDNQVIDVEVKEIKKDDTLIIRPGEQIPVDGVIIDGESNLNLSFLNGESLPKRVSSGDQVLSGSINMSGILKIKVKKSAEDSTASQILKYVKEAMKGKATSEKFITKFAKIYTPIVVGLAIIIAFFPLLFGQDFSFWLYRALTFLVVACPCALVISIPLSFFVGIASSAKKGVLFKGSNYLELFSKTDTIIFDKTGTLTQGDFLVSKIVGDNEENILEKAALVESFSNHPIARAIVKKYGKEVNAKLDSYQEIPGQGVSAYYQGHEIKVGKAEFVSEDIQEKEEGTAVHVSYKGEYLGYIVITDVLRDSAKRTIDAFKNLGIEVVMLSGDNKLSVGQSAKQLEADTFYSNLLPLEKVQIIDEYLKQEKIVTFVGDGINDAPVITKSSVGIAMGKLGSEATIEASDAVVMSDDLFSLVESKKVAKKTIKIIKENIIGIIVIKTLALTLGVLGFLPIWGAVLADVGLCLLAVFNALRIRF